MILVQPHLSSCYYFGFVGLHNFAAAFGRMIFAQNLNFITTIIGVTITIAGMPFLDSRIFVSSSLVDYLGFPEGFGCCTLLNSNFDFQSFVRFVVDFVLPLAYLLSNLVFLD